MFAFQVHDNQERDSELKVLVHQSHAGAVIGRGGSRIKELREETGVDLKVTSFTVNCYSLSNCEMLVFIVFSIKKFMFRHLQVYSECCPQSTERIIQINGQPEKIVACLVSIITTLKEVRKFCLEVNIEKLKFFFSIS